MFNRPLFTVVITCLFSILVVPLAVAGPLGNPFESHSGSAIAKEVADFTEDDDVGSLEFSTDGTRIAVGTFLKPNIHLWDIRSGPRVVQTLVRPKVGADYTSGGGLRFSPDGKLLAVAHGLAADSDGNSVVSIFSLATRDIIHSIPEPMGGGGYSRIAFSPDGQFLFRTYDSNRPPDRYQFIVHSKNNFGPVWGLSLMPFYPYSLALSPDGMTAAIGGQTLGPGVVHAARIVIVDLSRRKIASIINDALQEGAVQELAWHPDGVHLAAGGIMGHDSGKVDAVRVFDVSTGAMVSHESVGSAHIWALRYSQNGKYLIEAGIGETVRIWDGQHRQLLQEIRTKNGYALAVSKDSAFLAIGDGRKVTIWKLQ
jgi:WD40 repeat protein